MFKPGENGNAPGRKPGSKNRLLPEKVASEIGLHSRELLNAAIRAGKHDPAIALDLLRIWREENRTPDTDNLDVVALRTGSCMDWPLPPDVKTFEDALDALWQLQHGPMAKMARQMADDPLIIQRLAGTHLAAQQLPDEEGKSNG